MTSKSLNILSITIKKQLVNYYKCILIQYRILFSPWALNDNVIYRHVLLRLYQNDLERNAIL